LEAAKEYSPPAREPFVVVPSLPTASDLVIQPDDSTQSMELLVRQIERILALASHSDEALLSSSIVVCEQCVNKVVQESKRLFGDMERERQVLIKAVQECERFEFCLIEKFHRRNEEVEAHLNSNVEEQTVLLQRELKDCLEEEKRLQTEFDDCQSQMDELAVEEYKYEEALRSVQLDLIMYEEEKATVQRLKEYAETQLKRLQETDQ